MHLKVFLKLKNPKNSLLGKYLKKQKKTKKFQKTQENPLGWFFLKKTRVICNPAWSRSRSRVRSRSRSGPAAFSKRLMIVRLLYSTIASPSTSNRRTYATFRKLIKVYLVGK
jgi:hypothetical protein